MTNKTIASFKRKLLDLDQWKIEQSNKLREFHETQRKLLICDAQHAFKPSSAQSFESQNALISAQDGSNKENCRPTLLGEVDPSGPVRTRGGSDFLNSEEGVEIVLGESQNNSKQETRKEKKNFLKRGDGLARFRMTLQDFKNPPKIYKNRQFTAQINKKTEKNKWYGERGSLSKKEGQPAREKGNFSVDIYVPGSKSFPTNKLSTDPGRKKTGFSDAGRGTDDKCTVKVCTAAVQKGPVQNSFAVRVPITLNNYLIEGAKNSEFETKRDEKELRLFEILEEKVNESSFCSSSSFIDKLLDHSPFLSPPETFKVKNSQDMSHNGPEDALHPADTPKDDQPDAIQGRMTAEWSPNSQQDSDERRGDEHRTPSTGGPKVLQRGKGGNPDPSDVERGCSRRDPAKGPSERSFPRAQKDSNFLQEGDPRGGPPSREMALKLQRKGLQDNVKRLMSWEPSPRKKLPKRTPNKLKIPSKKTDNGKSSSRGQTENLILTSGLLRERLDELEKEITLFRRENARIQKLQKECHEDRIKLAKERKDFQKRMQQERETFETKMAEDRKKLQKDRNVFHMYYKQAKNRPGREERHQTEQLEKELQKILDATATKEARWAASQARSRIQIRTLQKENLRLKAECDQLRKSLSQKPLSARQNNINAKIIRAINAELAKLGTKTPVPADECRCPQSRSCAPENTHRPPLKDPLRRIKSAPDIKNISSPHSFTPTIASNLPSPSSCPSPTAANCLSLLPTHHIPSQEKQVPPSVSDDDDDDPPVNLIPFTSRTQPALDAALAKDNIHLPYGEYEATDDACCQEERPDSLEGFDCNDRLQDGKTGIMGEIGRSMPPSECKTKRGRTREKVLEDGTIEIVFPNGNVKKVSPDNKITRVVYYNGDIKEINSEEGSEKYYYCETRTWHITYRDGMEVIEFPELVMFLGPSPVEKPRAPGGQTERRYLDGSSEISFPNGCVRYCDSFGRDEWRFLDGTVMKSNQDGHKILLLANGQKEIQTKEYKQREYPDGTVKIIYSNGVEETRYASGRVRLKDPYGNLLMDSARI